MNQRPLRRRLTLWLLATAATYVFSRDASAATVFEGGVAISDGGVVAFGSRACAPDPQQRWKLPGRLHRSVLPETVRRAVRSRRLRLAPARAPATAG